MEAVVPLPVEVDPTAVAVGGAAAVAATPCRLDAAPLDDGDDEDEDDSASRGGGTAASDSESVYWSTRPSSFLRSCERPEEQEEQPLSESARG